MLVSNDNYLDLIYLCYEKQNTYVTTIYGFRFEYPVTLLERGLFLVSLFLAAIHEAIDRPVENLAVICSTIIDEPSAFVSIQILANLLAYLHALDVSNFLSNENFGIC